MGLTKKAVCSLAVSLALLLAPQQAFPQPAASADFRVLRSNGPSAPQYRFGRSFRRDARLVLQAGDKVLLLGGGGTRLLTGPGEFRLDQASFNPPQRRAEVRRAIAAERDEGNRPNIWVLRTYPDGAEPGFHEPMRFCTYRPQEIVIDAKGPVEIVGPGVPPRRFAFGRGYTSWGSFELWKRRPARDPDVYIFHLAEPDLHFPVQIVPLAARPSSVMEAAEQFGRNRCDHQLRYLTSWLDDAVFEPWPGSRQSVGDQPPSVDSGWVENNRYECLLVDAKLYAERAYRDEDPCDEPAEQVDRPE